MNTKSQLRSSVLARRDEMPEAVRARKSEAACKRVERVLDVAFAGANTGSLAAAADASARGSAPADGDGVASSVADARGSGVAAPEGVAGTGGRMGASSAPAVAVFASMHSEVDTRPLVDAAYRRGWNVCFPCMVRDAADKPSRMEFYRIGLEQLDAARASFLGTPMRCLACATLEHEGFQTVAPEELDAVVVPLVAFDDEGNRLGYGGGNYDRLLPRLRDDALVVGIAFDEQRVTDVPTEPHDQPLSLVVSA